METPKSTPAKTALKSAEAKLAAWDDQTASHMIVPQITPKLSPATDAVLAKLAK